MRKLITLSMALGLILAQSAALKAGDCGGSTKATPAAVTVKTDSQNIITTAKAAGSFTTLLAAVEAAGLADVLTGTGPFTVFAPTDEAFAKLPKGTVEALLKDSKKLSAILTYHVVSGAVPAAEVVKLKSVKTVNGQTATITVADGGVMLDGAKVLTTDIKCSNGIIHVIDSVILPKEDSN